MDPVDRRHTLDALIAAARAGNVGPDAFILSPNSPYRAEHAQISAYLDQARRVENYRALKPQHLDAGRVLVDGDQVARRRVLLATLERFVFGNCSYGPVDGPMSHALCALTCELLAYRLPLGHDDLLQLLDTVSLTSEPAAPCGCFHGVAPCLPLAVILGYVEGHVAAEGLTLGLRASLRCVRAALDRAADTLECRQARRAIGRLLKRETRLTGARRADHWPTRKHLAILHQA